MEEQRGPFFEWGVRAGGIAACAVSCQLCREQLIEKVRGLRREGKRDEVEAMKPEFDTNRDTWQTILGDAKKFHGEFEAKFPDRADQNKFVAHIRRDAYANTFRVRYGDDIVNVASQIMWVVAPWDKDTQGVLQLRLQTDCNITDTHPQSLKRLIKAGEAKMKDLAKELPTLEEMATGKADFGAQQVSDQMDEITANIGCAQRVLARVEGAAMRRQDERKMQQGTGEEETGSGKVEDDPVKKLEGEIARKERMLQAVVVNQEFEKALALRDEIKGLKEQLEVEKRKLRESGATVMAGATPVETPMVKLQQVMVVDEETGTEVRIEDLIAKYETQVVELNEAAAKHEADAATVEAEGDKIILEAGKKAEAGKKFMLAETSRNLATKCREDGAKLAEKITQLQSHETEEKARLADEAKKLVKDAAAPAVATTPQVGTLAVAVTDEDPIAALEAFVEDAEGAEMVAAVADLLEAAKVAREKNKGAKQIRKAVDAAKKGDVKAIEAKTAALVALAR